MNTQNQFLQADHDLLISLNTKFDIKFDTLSNDIKTWSDNVALKLTDLDLRLKSLEKIRDSINIEEVLKHVDEVYEWKKQSQFMQKVFLTIAGFIGAAVSSITYFILSFYQVSHQVKP